MTPIPLVPPCTRKVSPLASRARSNTFDQTVKKVSGRLAASTSFKPTGTGRHCATGATVIATAGSDDKCAACVQLGAHHAINYRTQDFVAEAKRLTGGRGVDVVLDMVAGPYVAREVQCMAEDGRLAIIAVQGGIESQFDAGVVLRKRLTITGSTLRPRPVAFKGAIASALREKVWPWLESGQVKPVVHSVFPAAEAAAAHALMESNLHVGKIVLVW